jgi:hypothetical protein
MSADSRVVVRDPVDPRELFDVARLATGVTGGEWLLLDGNRPGQSAVWRAEPMYRATANLPQGTVAKVLRRAPSQVPGALVGSVTVSYAASGAMLPGDPEADFPPGYAVIGVHGGYYGDAELTECRADHAALVAVLGKWLTARALRWSWRFEEDQWIPGAAS